MSTKLEYVQALEDQIATAKQQLNTLKAKKETALIAAQHEEIEHLEKYLDEANINLTGISEAAEEAWQDLKESLDTLMKTVTDRLKQLIGDGDDAENP